MRCAVSLGLLVLSMLGSGCSACGAPTRTRPGGGDAGDSSALDAAGGGTDSGRPPPAATEACNEVDDTGDGIVDEGCDCALGASQPCFPGSASRRGFGACRDGVQTCEMFGEFRAWGACAGAVLPSAEIEGNCVDEDCDGNAPGCGSSCGEIEDCDNGLDDECDGLVDCDDSDCARTPGCRSSCVPSEFGESMCSDGRDNDCDGLVDCADPECASATPCVPPPPPPPGCTREFPFLVEVRCSDGRDNDCDGRVDCDDSDCRTPGSCGCSPSETACTDGSDEDCDRSTDCGDVDCQRCTPGTRRWCDDPMYCHWGRQECGPDGRWGACVETTERPGRCTGSLYSASCCVEAGECCENYPVDRSSIGNCTGISECSG